MDPVKLVVHCTDGKLLKGYSLDFFPDKKAFHILPSPNSSENSSEVLIKNLKAVFFVREFEGNPVHEERKVYHEEERPQGRKVEITFNDGEVLVGSTLGYDPTRQGFFVFPADPGSNNIRVFVVTAAVKSVQYL